MLKFCFKLKDGQRVPILPKAAPLLPSPDDGETPEERLLIANVNKDINKQLSTARRGNGGKYNKLDDESRMKIAKKCLDVGPAKTVRFFHDKGLELSGQCDLIKSGFSQAGI